MLHSSQYSQTGKPENSAISGKPLNPEDPVFQVNGLMLGVKARELWGTTPAEFEALKAEWASYLPKTEVAAPDAPVYDDMSLEELKTTAADKGVDITGRRSKEDIKQALRAADVMARFAAPTPSETGSPLDLGKATGE